MYVSGGVPRSVELDGESYPRRERLTDREREREIIDDENKNTGWRVRTTDQKKKKD
jgi:hypothetical protein